MYKYVSVAEMVAVEKAANTGGISYAQMMENAGKALAEMVNAAYSHIQQKSICGLVGKGNNGGDTLVALAEMAGWGWKTSAYVVGGRGEGDELSLRLEKAGGVVYQDADDQVAQDVL